MLEGSFEDSEETAPEIIPTSMNFGSLPMCNGLTRLETRFYNQQEDLEKIQSTLGKPLDAEQALDLGLVTFIPDDIDWEDEVRLAIEERSSFSPDALTGMEASLRFPGPETLETKIFGRLSAWQNWIFQRPNAVGEEGEVMIRTSMGTLTAPPNRGNPAFVVSVKDSGDGIAPEHLEKLFIPFFTTKREGTGLGLAICRRMVEAHGGEIAVQSKVGEGCTFTMRFPLKVPDLESDETLS